MKNSDQERGFDHSLKLITKSSLIVLIGIFLSKLITYIYRIIIARTFEPNAYGLFSIALIFISIFAMFAAFGLDSGLLRFVSLYRGKKETDKSRYIFKLSFKLIFVASLLLGLLFFLLSDFIAIEIFKDYSLSILLKYSSIFIPFIALVGIFWSILKAYEEIGWYSFLSNILCLFLQLIILILLISLGVGTDSIIFSYLIGYGIIFFISLIICKYKIPEIFKKPNLNLNEKFAIRKEFFAYSLPIVLLGLFSILFSYADSFLIGYFLNAENVGIYNAAVPIAALLLIVPSLFTQLFFPLITREFSKGNKEIIEQLSRQVSKWIFVLNLPLLVLFVLFPGAIINILFGAEYLPAENSLRFLAAGIFFYSSFSIIPENILSMAGKSKIIMLNKLISVGINIALCITLIPKFGMEGAAIAIMTSYVCLGTLDMIQSIRKTGIIPLRRKMFRIVLVALTSAAILLILRGFIEINLVSIILLAIFFFLLYIVLILATKSLDKNDLMILKTIKLKILSSSQNKKIFK
jgi:O-antigen/teichoic acid export membrane protein